MRDIKSAWNELPRKEKIRARLNIQYRKDLNTLMKTPEGRRVFAFLLMRCGFMDSFPQGNSKDIFNAGRRAVAIELINDVDSIDWPHRTSGFDLRQLADREYREFGLAVNDEIETLERRKSDAK